MPLPNCIPTLMRSVRSFHSVFTYFIFFHIFYLFASLCYILHSFFIPSSAMSKLLHILNFKSVTFTSRKSIWLFSNLLIFNSFFFLNNFKSFFYLSNQYIEHIIPKSDVFMGLSCWFCWFLLRHLYSLCLLWFLTLSSYSLELYLWEFSEIWVKGERLH